MVGGALNQCINSRKCILVIQLMQTASLMQPADRLGAAGRFDQVLQGERSRPIERTNNQIIANQPWFAELMLSEQHGGAGSAVFRFDEYDTAVAVERQNIILDRNEGPPIVVRISAAA